MNDDEVAEAIQRRLETEGTIPENQLVEVDYILACRVRILHPDYKDTLWPTLRSSSVDIGDHIGLADIMWGEAQERKRSRRQ